MGSSPGPGSDGLPGSTSKLVSVITDAVVNNEFYIYTDPNIVESVAARHRAIEQRGFPTTGRMDADVTGG